MRSFRSLPALLAVLVLAATAVTAAGAETPTGAGNWDSWNKGLNGSRHAAGESRITQRTAGQLKLKWAFQLPRLTDTMGKSQPVLAHTPAVTTSPGLVYLGSMDGKFRVYSSRTGRVLWEYDTVRDFAAVNGAGRGSAISGNGGAVVAGGMVYVHSGYYPFYPSPSDKGFVLLAFGL